MRRIFFIMLSLFIFIGLVLSISLVSVYRAATYYHQFYQLNEPPSFSTTLVLGHKLEHDLPSDILLSRLDKAFDLYRNDYTERIIVSGGILGENQKSEAEVMKAILVEKGVPEENIFMEARASSTIENFQFSRVILDSLKEQQVILVTSEFHVFRAQLIADNNGIYAVPVPSNSPDEGLFQLLRESILSVFYLSIQQWGIDEHPNPIHPSFKPEKEMMAMQKFIKTQH
ncbi:MAG: YdcF family protein [Chloroherpetonaceae bacterium]|nr:YdcF family protein [Chloroherpetonaceae bacterium]